ncbi:MAG TPA: aminoacyl-tRNA hydrolase [Phycisphaerales bacterium]|nr:aminoacyl-tRNA hydrolase [Phycisphaerales bacterium]
MKLIVGLGNPGPQYDKTRHNAGFMAVDRLAKRWAGGAIPKGRFSGVCTEAAIKSERCILLKPTTFMNLSGRSVAEALGFYKLDLKTDLLVLVDDTALPFGAIRLRPSGSAGGHNGLADIERALSSPDYPRLRIGIGGVDAKPPHMPQHDYVLGRFTPEQAALIEPALDKAADAAETFITSGIEAAMNKHNTKPPPPPAPPAPPNSAAAA